MRRATSRQKEATVPTRRRTGVHQRWHWRPKHPLEPALHHLHVVVASPDPVELEVPIVGDVVLHGRAPVHPGGRVRAGRARRMRPAVGVRPVQAGHAGRGEARVAEEAPGEASAAPAVPDVVGEVVPAAEVPREAGASVADHRAADSPREVGALGVHDARADPAEGGRFGAGGRRVGGALLDRDRLESHDAPRLGSCGRRA